MTRPLSEMARGAGFVFRGFEWLAHPQLRRLVIMPILINIGVIIGLVSLIGWQLDHWLALWLAALPAWLAWLETVLWLLGVVLAMIVFALLFTILANLIASPFNPFLSARVEVLVRGRSPESGLGLAAEVGDAIGSEIRRLLYYASRALLLLGITFVLGFIPVVNLVVAPLWFGFGALMLAFEYVDQPLGNRALSFDRKMQFVRAHLWRHLGFGSVVTLMTLVPFANLVVMPAAVIGATRLFIDTAANDAAILDVKH